MSMTAPTRRDAESLWAAAVMAQPALYNNPVSKEKQREDERVAMREAGIELAFQLLKRK